MTELKVIGVPGEGAEDVLVGADGWVYTGTADGAVFKVRPDGQRIDLVGNTGGRPLGLEWLSDGRLLVCDGIGGLLAMDTSTGATEVLATEADGRPILVCNNAAVAENGDVYFTDSSRVHPLHEWKADLIENTRSGRLLRRNTDGTVDVLLDGLAFANGVALPADESYVLVAESAARTVARRWLTGTRAGQVDQFAADLPGYPDNIARGTDGLIWVSIGSPVEPKLERVMVAPPVLRRLAARLPERLQVQPRKTVRVLAFDDEGRTMHDRSLDASRFHMVTGVREHDGLVWLGSLAHPAIACFSW